MTKKLKWLVVALGVGSAINKAYRRKWKRRLWDVPMVPTYVPKEDLWIVDLDTEGEVKVR